MDITEPLRKDLLLVAACLLVGVAAVGAHNVATPDEPVRVGMVEVEIRCLGIDVGACLGYQQQEHVTYNYDNYSEISEGDPNFYRKVESELMLRAYNTCDSSMDGYDWTSEVSYQGQTAEEWRQNEEVELLPCEDAFYRNMTAAR